MTAKKLEAPELLAGAATPRLKELRNVVMHMQENPLLYAAGVVLVLVSIFAGLAWRVASNLNEQRIMTEYASAVSNTEDEAARAAKLEQLAKGNNGQLSAEVLYMAGETAIGQKNYDAARDAFTKVVSGHASSEFAPRAAEGLGWLLENAGDNAGALAAYQEVEAKWGGSFTGKLQQLNIARVQEKLGDFAKAKEAYEAQKMRFPDSRAAALADEALERLKGSHADLFPAEAAPEAAAPAAEAPETAEIPAETPETAAEEPAESASADSETAPETAPEEAAQ